ncbi:MAG: helix-turn-helix domain-containing protein [Candidatus Bathyarchaeia archaeon]
MDRKVNKYFVTIPIFDSQTAKLLAPETNWKILEALRDVGMEGLSAEEISEKIKVPISSVYNILRTLEATGWVQSTMKRPPWGRPSKKIKQRFGGKPTRVFIETVPWGLNELDYDFIDSLIPVLKDMKNNVDELREKWLSILEKIVLTYQANNLKKFFPQEPIDSECGHSREGLEFLRAISTELVWEILNGKDFDALARKHKFMK